MNLIQIQILICIKYNWNEKNENKKKTKDSKKILSPCSQKKKNNFSKSLLKDFESNNGLLSPKKVSRRANITKEKNTERISAQANKITRKHLQYMTNNNNILNLLVFYYIERRIYSSISCIIFDNSFF